MPADIFSLVVLACMGTPSASTCSVKSLEQPTLMTTPQCEAMFTHLSESLASRKSPAKVVAHHCLKLPGLFGSAAPKLAEIAPAPKPALPETAPQDDTTAPDADGKSHI